MIKDIKGIQDFELTRGKLAPYVTPYQEEATKTINFDPSMSIVDIQGLIDSAYLDLNRYKNFVLQFADGIYNLNNFICINGFRGASSIFIQGNISEDYRNLHVNQSVNLNFLNSYNYGLLIQANQLSGIYIRNLKITKQSLGHNGSTNNCIYFLQNGGTYIEYMGCYTSLSDNKGYNVYAKNSTVYTQYNYVSGGYCGIYAYEGANIRSGYNESYGTSPLYGLITYGGGNISKNTSQSQPNGINANEYQGAGTGRIA